MTHASEIDSSALQGIAANVAPGQPWSAYQVGGSCARPPPQEAIPERLRARVALLGSFTLDPFVPVLRVEAARAGLWLDTYVAPYGQYHVGAARSPAPASTSSGPTSRSSPSTRDVLWNQRWAESPPLKSEPVVGGLLTPLFAGLDVFDRAGSGIVVMNDFVLPRRSTEGVNAFRSKGTFAHTDRPREQAPPAAARAPGSHLPVPARGRRGAGGPRPGLQLADALSRARDLVGHADGRRGGAVRGLRPRRDRQGDEVHRARPGQHALGRRAGRGRPRRGSRWARSGRAASSWISSGSCSTSSGRASCWRICSKNNEPEALAVLRDHPSMLIRESHLAAYRDQLGGQGHQHPRARPRS